MQSANAVLMKFFKLPPAVRMMLALAGFGSLATILFALFPSLRTREGRFMLLIIAGIGVALFLVIWGIRRLFFRRKSAQLDSALDSQGPTRGDIAEQERIYREKFRNKLNGLKENGLNVYRLPWFVLVGEPGCGKTASLIHSGLDMPLGKDEVPGFGGTRNYNWWFTNEAVILDTAGRIAFQEEGTTDKVEWEYFLKLLKTNRQRCPINGVVIAVPADKLLRDNAEERAQKAAILRERLRQMHQTLGVRFPTFLLVTKMDLVGGFSEFFEEMRVNLQQRNQMFGWSRPGEFQQPYDPESFPESFDDVYSRLRNWGMRYLQRKTTDDELGMIVTFPEAFRHLREPLHDYIATVFQKSPLVEPPFFRGFYFTSAVQEGAPILDVFAKSKAGIQLAERPTKAVDSKAFFIHDFYDHKVFPEQGLVFRSAKHVSLNQRMRRMVWVGSAAMLVVMVALFAFGITGVHGMVTAPRAASEAAIGAIEKGEASYADLAGNLRTAKSLRGFYEAYDAPWAGFKARLLFIGADIDKPQEDVGRIHARFVLDCIAKPILGEVEARLTGMDLPADMPQAQRERYVAALRVYTKWYGEVAGQHDLPELDGQEAVLRRTEFEALLALLDLADADREDAAQQFEYALSSLTSESRSFAREVLRDGLGFDVTHATQTIVQAVQRITDSWKPLTQLSADNTNPMVKYWADFAARVGELRDRYGEILSLAADFRDESKFEAAVERFMALTAGVEHLGDPDFSSPEPRTLHEAYYNLMVFLANTSPPETADHRIVRLGGLLEVFQSQWDGEFNGLREALAAGAPDANRQPQSAVYEALDQGQEDLATAFKRSLTQIRERLGLPAGVEPLTVYVDQNLIEVREANPPSPFEGSAEVRLARNALGMNERARTYLVELRQMIGGAGQELKELEDLNNWPGLLERLSAAEPAGRLLGTWFTEVARDRGGNPDDLIRQKSGLKEYAFWKPVELYGLAQQMWEARSEDSATRLLGRMSQKAADTLKQDSMPGLARLMPEFDQPSTLPFDQHRFNMQQAAVRPPIARDEDDNQADTNEDEEDDGGLHRLRRRAPKPEPEDEGERLERDKTSALLFQYHTRDMLIRTLRQYERVAAALDRYEGSKPVAAALADAANGYIDAYFGDWFDLYSDPTRLLDEDTLVLLEKCHKAELSWPDYVSTLVEDDGRIANALADRMEALIRHTVMFDYELAEGDIDDAVYDRIADRLAELNRQGRSLPNLLRAMRDRRNLPRSGEGEPEVVYARQLVDAWDDYVREVRGLGALSGDEQRSTGTPPNLEQLADNIVYEQAASTQFPLIAPVLDLASYGQELLVHHLAARLVTIFAEHAGRYPILHADDAHDDTALLTLMKDRAMMDPTTFLALLKQTREFTDRYGDLMAEVQPNSPARRTLHVSDGWVRFLYEQPEALLRDEKPRPLDTWLAIVRDPSGTVANAGNVYSKLTISLPLLTPYGAAAKPLEVAVRAGEGIVAGTVQEAVGNEQAEYRWDLLAAADVTFERMSAVVSEKHPDARDEYPEQAVAWNLPAQPWSLLMAMGAREDNDLGDGYWKIPVRMETGVNPIGFLIGVRIGNSERPFPGAIPPPPDPGPRPEMSRAEAYLRGQR